MARTIAPKIDARLFTAQINAKEKARCNIRQYIPIGAIKGNFWDDAPAPGMYYDTDINMWCPESFKLEKMEIIEEVSETRLPMKKGKDILSTARNLSHTCLLSLNG